jgi:hypothetical protein
MIELDFTLTPRDGDWACTMDGRILAGRTPLEALHQGLQGVIWSGRYKVAKAIPIKDLTVEAATT